MADSTRKLDRYKKRHEALKQKRASWIDHWRDVSQYVKPRRRRFEPGEYNEGTKRNQKIINNTATRSLRVQTAGLQGGITNPARVWYRLISSDPKINSDAEARAWLSQADDVTLDIFSRSNFYNATPLVYDDLGLYGVAAVYAEEDPLGDVVRFHAFPIGSYCLALNAKNKVDVIYRDTVMTVGQLAEKFGLENCSVAVNNRHKEGALDDVIEVVHCIQPNTDRKLGMADATGKAFESVWYEAGSNVEGDNKFLGVNGYNEFPVMCPRWAPSAEEIYSDSPGMVALGDIKALQHLEKKAAIVMDKIVDPPMAAPEGLRTESKSTVSGDVTYLSGSAGGSGQKFEPVYTIDPRALAVENSIRRHELRIERAFNVHIFLMAANTDSPQQTAREVDEKHEEKMLQLGTAYGAMKDEFLDLVVSRVLAIAIRAGMLPEPPEILQGQDIDVEHLSIMAQAQKLLDAVSIERMGRQVAEFTAIDAEAADVFNVITASNHYGRAIGVEPDVLRTEDEVLQIREQRRQQQMAAQEAKLMAGAAKDAATAAKTMGETEGAGIQQIMQSMGVA